MTTVGIRHLSFTLGDQRVSYRELPDIEQRIRELNIPDDEELWNWGYCRRSSKDYPAFIVDGCGELFASLAAAGIEIDAVLGCAPLHNSTERFMAALRSGVVPELAGSGERLRCVSDRDCVNVLQALADARDLIRSGCRHVLIMAAEKVEDERSRFRKYSVFSDFCLALVVSGQLEHCEYEIVDVQIRVDPRPGEDTSGILTRNLEKECVAGLLAEHGVAAAEISRFFYLNLFQPIAEMKAMHTGFAASQIYTAATKEIGHCYGADPFINMRTDLATGGGGHTYALCASGRGHAGAALVRRLR